MLAAQDELVLPGRGSDLQSYAVRTGEHQELAATRALQGIRLAIGQGEDLEEMATLATLRN